MVNLMSNVSARLDKCPKVTMRLHSLEVYKGVWCVFRSMDVSQFTQGPVVRPILEHYMDQLTTLNVVLRLTGDLGKWRKSFSPRDVRAPWDT